MLETSVGVLRGFSGLGFETPHLIFGLEHAPGL